MLAFVCTVFTERCSASAEAQDETRRSWLSEVVLSVLVAVGVVFGLLVIAASLLTCCCGLFWCISGHRSIAGLY